MPHLIKYLSYACRKLYMVVYSYVFLYHQDKPAIRTHHSNVTGCRNCQLWEYCLEVELFVGATVTLLSI
jgi:hypothetical protein